jgi:hypothetical protein
MIFSSANIPAISCVITADLPSRCHQRNQANGRAAGFDAFSGSQKPDQGRVKLIPDPCQVFEPPAKALLQVIRNCKYGWG